MRGFESTGGGPGVFAPLVVIRPMPRSLGSVNQRLLSGPVVIAVGSATAPSEAGGIGNSVMAPLVVIRPMPRLLGSVNQRLLSGPVVIAVGSATAPFDAAGIGNSVNVTPVLALQIDGATHAAVAMRALKVNLRRQATMIISTSLVVRGRLWDRLA